MVKKVITLGMLLVFFFHFANTILFNSPLNPVKAKYSQHVFQYMDPLFMQNWRLFAPNPATNNNDFYVRAKLKDGDEVQVTDWIDLTSHMIERNQANRFTPYNRIVRIQRGAVTMMGEDDDLLVTLHRKSDQNEEAKQTLNDLENEERMTERQAFADKLLTRYAQAYLRSLYPEKELVETQIMLLDTKAVPFSKKDDVHFEREQKAYEFTWQPAQKVTPMF
ncbi:DUF5819 family protein [Shouchella lonarensis]|uniref:Uncharacterized protein n=1 Tax=Shouchella lonarensis TaxID=1464122 RepID=A0A1G6IMP5_9BACI|nr:DUF5819 family protein [Shouchella lonarensis]SDC07701.1 hypothetical protein SAMN05421737_105113 [Shouchella lonarensis]